MSPRVATRLIVVIIVVALGVVIAAGGSRVLDVTTHRVAVVFLAGHRNLAGQHAEEADDQRRADWVATLESSFVFFRGKLEWAEFAAAARRAVLAVDQQRTSWVVDVTEQIRCQLDASGREIEG